jgi:prepilin peptidase CpaA
MILQILLLGFLPALLIVAAIWDLLSYTIPNTIVLALLGLFAVFLAALAVTGATGDWAAIALHLAAGAAALAAGMLLFAFGWIGGGDAKLFAAASLWLGWNALFEYAILATLFGGVLTLSLLFLRRLPLPAFLVRLKWFARLSDHKEGIPYGVALSVAALILLPETELFRLSLQS